MIQLKDDLQVSIEPGQLITVTWRQPIHKVLGMAKIWQTINWVVSTRVVATHFMFHHRVHTQGILTVSARVERTVARIIWAVSKRLSLGTNIQSKICCLCVHKELQNSFNIGSLRQH